MVYTGVCFQRVEKRFYFEIFVFYGVIILFFICRCKSL